jgi:hypothetical protein
MEHLPYHHCAATPQVEIPYLCNNIAAEDEYDGVGFCDFPLRRGWAMGHDPYAWSDDLDEMKIAIRAQSWLYFGLLSELLGERINKERFTVRSRSGNGLKIDSKRIKQQLFRRLKYVLGGQVPFMWITRKRILQFEDALSCLSSATQHCEVFDEFSDRCD